MAMTLWGLSLLGYACAGWLAARRKQGAEALLLCLLLVPLCVIWAAWSRPAGYEAYDQTARLAVSAAFPLGIWLLWRPGYLPRRRAVLQGLIQLGMVLLWGLIAAAKGGFPRAAGLLLASLSAFLLLPCRWTPAGTEGAAKLAMPFSLAVLAGMAAAWSLKGPDGGWLLAGALGAGMAGMAAAGLDAMKGIWAGRLLSVGLLPGIYTLLQPVAAPVYAVTLDMPFQVMVTALIYIPPMVDGRTRRWQGVALLCLAVLYELTIRWLG